VKVFASDKDDLACSALKAALSTAPSPDAAAM
jgi:hypothetical protein